MRQIIFFLVAISMSLPPWTIYEAAAQVNAPPSVDQQAIIERLDELIGLIEATRSQVDRSQFEIEALLDKLDFDAEQIVSFVASSISYEPYYGSLRGVQGTLVSRSGNSLDQSLLMAALLKNAGYEARLVEFDLDQKNTDLLLRQIPVAADRPSTPFLSVPSFLLEAEDETGPIWDRGFQIEADDANTVRSIAEHIFDSLKSKGITVGDSNAAKRIEFEAKSYFAVEYRFGPFDAWRLEHPAFGKATPNLDQMTTVSYYEEQIPSDLQHKFAFQILAERRFGSTIDQLPLMDRWVRPTANLFGTELSFAFVPPDLGDVAKKIRDQLPENVGSEAAQVTDFTSSITNYLANSGSEFFVPIFNGSIPNGAQVFDFEGNIVSADLASTQATALFRTFASATGQAVSAIQSLESDQDEFSSPASELMKVWVEYSIITPNGSSRIIRRNIFDKSYSIDPHSKEEFVFDVITSSSIMLSMGHSNRAYLLDRYLDHYLHTQNAIREVVRNEGDISIQVLADKFMSDSRLQSREADLLRLYYAFDSWDSSGGSHHFRAEPSVVSIEDGFEYSSSTRFKVGVDIVSNDRRVISIDDGELSANARDAIEIGVWDTFVEKKFLDESFPYADVVVDNISRYGAFDELVPNGKSIDSFDVLISSAPEHEDVISGFSETSREPLNRDIGDGYAVLMPANVSDSSKVSWWRVDPISGTTVGVISNGRGGEFLEWLKTVTGISTKAILAGRFVQASFYYLLCHAIIGARAGGYIGHGEDVTNCIGGAAVVFTFGMRGPILGLLVANLLYVLMGGVSVTVGPN